MISESTRFLAQPREMRPTVMGDVLTDSLLATPGLCPNPSLKAMVGNLR